MPRYERVLLQLPEETQRQYNLARDFGKPPRVLQLLTSGLLRVGNGWHGETVFDELPSPKLGWLCRWARDTLKPNLDRRAVVWCAHPEELNLISRELAKVLGMPFVGSVTMPCWRHLFESGRVAGLQAMVVRYDQRTCACDFPSADYHIQFSPPGDAWQPGFRLLPKAVTVYQLIVAGTIDEAISQSATIRKEIRPA